MNIGFLVCPGTMPGSPNRREDAFEHDLQVDAIRPEIEKLGGTLTEIDWHSPIESFARIDLVLVGTPWDYWDFEQEFLAKLDALEQSGITVCNPPDLVRWNSRKTYLRGLEALGVATIPTLWIEKTSAADIDAAMRTFHCDTVVAKRQVGDGADGQTIHRMGEIDPRWHMLHPAMIQPYLPQIASEGEYSFLFIDGQFSHALVKRPADGDYRVQSLYGGTEQAIEPAPHDLVVAQGVISAIPFETPLYARIDMVRGDGNRLLLMEAELIEPYLYPEQGPELGPRMARAIASRIANA
jgi:glutathione synthase/RimK-type ligase-like ATP-grasp enzyme